MKPLNGSYVSTAKTYNDLLVLLRSKLTVIRIRIRSSNGVHVKKLCQGCAETVKNKNMTPQMCRRRQMMFLLLTYFSFANDCALCLVYIEQMYTILKA